MQSGVLTILQDHRGRARAVKAATIARRLGLSGRYADRPVREAIKELRRQGYLILSSVKKPYGYYIATSQEEWIEFRDTNLKPRALDILETASAMGRAATAEWGGMQQLKLEMI